MKKSEFKKLKNGDTVTLRTLEELKQLKCYDKKRNCIIADDRRAYKFPYAFLGEDAIIVDEFWSDAAKSVIVEGYFRAVIVRQQLK